MSSFLDKILEAKKAEIAQSKQLTAFDKVKQQAVVRSDYRGFKKSMDQSGVRIIAEIKRASPSKGDIRSDLSPSQLAGAYERGGAAALSVLTEPAFFKGSVQDFRQARSSVKLPVLRKDFIIEPYQVYESAAIGADAILLIVRILDDENLHALYHLAKDIGLDVLVEVFDLRDAERATALNADLIGINNRDLAYFSTDVNQAVRIAAVLPEGTATVAASGIHTVADITFNLRNDIRRFLIGESLVKQGDPEATLREWRSQCVCTD